MALHFGMQQAIKAGYQNIHIEGDDKIYKDAIIKGNSPSTWQVYFIIEDITNLMGMTLRLVVLVFVFLDQLFSLVVHHLCFLLFYLPII